MFIVLEIISIRDSTKIEVVPAYEIREKKAIQVYIYIYTYVCIYIYVHYE